MIENNNDVAQTTQVQTEKKAKQTNRRRYFNKNKAKTAENLSTISVISAEQNAENTVIEQKVVEKKQNAKKSPAKQSNKQTQNTFVTPRLLDVNNKNLNQVINLAPKKQKNKKALRVMFLGGVGEIGKNMMALEYGDDIILKNIK